MLLVMVGKLDAALKHDGVGNGEVRSRGRGAEGKDRDESKERYGTHGVGEEKVESGF